MVVAIIAVGVGATKSHGNEWIAQQESFESLLADLNGGGSGKLFNNYEWLPISGTFPFEGQLRDQ